MAETSQDVDSLTQDLDETDWFVLGDVDGNGDVNQTDAIRLFGYLYRGEEAPPCLAAADIDGDGHLAVTDGVNILGWLFRGDTRFTLGECVAHDPEPGLSCDTPAAEMCGTCSPDAECNDGDLDAQPCSGTCGGSGVRVRSCNGCTWGEFGACHAEDSGACTPGAVDRRPCAAQCGGGFQERMCTGACTWGAFGACSAPTGECRAGDIETRSCAGRCGGGQQVRRCSNSCDWEPFSECTGDFGSCTPGETQERSCASGCGRETRTCTASCEWGPYAGTCTTTPTVTYACAFTGCPTGSFPSRGFYPTVESEHRCGRDATGRLNPVLECTTLCNQPEVRLCHYDEDPTRGGRSGRTQCPAGYWRARGQSPSPWCVGSDVEVICRRR